MIYLLIEDSDPDAFLTQAELKRRPNARVERVKDGQEAIDYLLGTQPYNDRKRYPYPDVILLDLKLPRVDGFDFLEWRRTESPRELRVIPVVILSGSDLQEDVCRAYFLGANRYMAKPSGLERLRKQMELADEVWSQFTVLPKPDACKWMWGPDAAT